MKKIFFKVGGIICFIVFLGINTTLAQNTYKVSNTQWFGHTFTVNLNPKFDFSFNSQYRRKDYLKAPNLVLFRPGLSYKLNNKTAFTAGYAYINTYVSETQDKIEHRYWEQVSYNPRFKNIDVSGRLRIEQRNSFNQTKDGTTKNNPFENRYRFQVKWEKKLNKLKKAYITANDEYMIHSIRNQTDKPIFDQNRAFAGFGYNFHKLARLELGYMHIYQEIKGSDTKAINHILILNMYSTIGLKKK